MHARIEHITRDYPERIVLVGSEQSLSARQVNVWANRVAHLLIASGIEIESRVAVVMQRSVERVIVQLALTKIGAVFVPVDPDYPSSRIEAILEGGRVELIVADRPSLAHDRVETLVFSDLQDRIDQQPPDNPQVDVPEEGALCVLFTSGSTGKPKGVVMRRASVSGILEWKQRAYPLGEGMAVLHKTPFTFDVSLWELYAPLMFGARLVLAPHGVHRDVRKLQSMIAEHGITHLQVVPTQLAELVDQTPLERCESLRVVVSAGEVLTPDLKDRFLETVPEATLHNLYGPTETYFTTYWDCQKTEASQEQTSVPIGYAIEGFRLYALDDELEPVEHQSAQLYVGGLGVARCYANEPRRTAERFVPVSGSSFAGERVYRTGDLVEIGDSREFYFLGRADRQIKLRGNRVELDEVELVLARHEAVQQAVVIALHSSDGTRFERLVAYVRTADQHDALGDEIREFARAHLPEYAVPGQVHQVDEFPLTSSGKIDRVALQKSTDATPDQSEEHESGPTTATEAELLEIWKVELGVDELSVNDNFFAAGGHSLIAVRILAEVDDLLGVDLSLDALLGRGASIKELGAQIDAIRTSDEARPEKAPQVPRVGSYTDTAPLSVQQRQLWTLQFLTRDSTAYHAPGVFRIQGQLDVERLQAALAVLVERHEILRTFYPLEDGDVVQKIKPPTGSIDVNYEDLRDLETPEKTARERVETLITIGFELTQEPPFRVDLFRLDDSQWLLLFMSHQIAIDLRAFDIVLKELQTLYLDADGLKPVAGQYAEFALWQKQRLESDDYHEAIAFWQEKLKVAPRRIEWPMGREVSEGRHWAGYVQREWTPQTSELVARFGRERETTDFQVLLAGLTAFLAYYLGQTDLTIGVGVSQRPEADAMDVVGNMMNMVPVRGRPDTEAPFEEYFERSREQWEASRPYQWIPLEHVVAELGGERTPGANTLYDVVFTYVPPTLVRRSGEATSFRARLGEARVEPYDYGGLPDSFCGLVVSATRNKQGHISTEFEYDMARFDHDSIARLAGRFERTLGRWLERAEYTTSQSGLR